MTTSTDSTPIHLNPIEDTATSQWLDEALRHERERVTEGPSAAAIDRIRAQVFAQAEARKLRNIAA